MPKSSAPPKIARCIRLSPLADRQLRELAAAWQLTMSETVVLLIDRAWIASQAHAIATTADAEVRGGLAAAIALEAHN